MNTLAGAVAHFMRAMAMDMDAAALAQLDAEREALIEDFLEGFEQGGGLVVSRGRRRGALRAEVLRWNAQEGFKLYPGSSRMH